MLDQTNVLSFRAKGKIPHQLIFMFPSQGGNAVCTSKRNVPPGPVLMEELVGKAGRLQLWREGRVGQGRGAGCWRLPCRSLKCTVVQLKKITAYVLNLNDHNRLSFQLGWSAQNCLLPFPVGFLPVQRVGSDVMLHICHVHVGPARRGQTQ